MKKEGNSNNSKTSVNEDSKISEIAQLLSAMKDGIQKIKLSQKKKDAEQLSAAKHEILGFQKKLAELL